MGKIEVYKDSQGEWRWRRFADNSVQIGKSNEGYKNKSDCESNAIREEKSDKWEFYTDNAGEWRWTRTARNGKIVGAAIHLKIAVREMLY